MKYLSCFLLLYNITLSETLQTKREKNFEKNEIKYLTSKKLKFIIKTQSRKEQYMANTLKTLRRFRGMTQEELAKETGITSRTIMSYENDVKKLRRASYEKIKKLASALDVSVDDIFLDDVSDFLKLPS